MELICERDTRFGSGGTISIHCSYSTYKGKKVWISTNQPSGKGHEQGKITTLAQQRGLIRNRGADRALSRPRKTEL